MTRTLRLVGLQIALVAMVLRALLPVGWMPGHDTPFVICTINGAVTLAPAKPGQPVDQDKADHQLCPFAAAIHLAVAPAAIALAPPSQFARTQSRSVTDIRASSAFAPYSSRAPPSFV